MNNSTKAKATTTIEKVRHVSIVTINWEGMTEEDVQALAQRALIIRKQNADRINGVVPAAEYALLATDYKLGVRAERKTKAPMTPQEACRMLSIEEIEKALADKRAQG